MDDFTGVVQGDNCFGWTVTGIGSGYGVTTAGKPAHELSCTIARPVTLLRARAIDADWPVCVRERYMVATKPRHLDARASGPLATARAI